MSEGKEKRFDGSLALAFQFSQYLSAWVASRSAASWGAAGRIPPDAIPASGSAGAMDKQDRFGRELRLGGPSDTTVVKG